MEAKDRQHPTMICVATITEIKNEKLLIHFDGWTNKYDYWCDAISNDIHPVGWCGNNAVDQLHKPKCKYGSSYKLAVKSNPRSSNGLWMEV